MSNSNEVLPPVVVNVVVELSLEDAFELFTRGIQEWWPLASHSVGAEKATSVHFESRVGGQIYEIDEDGSRHEWGEVLEIDPPRSVVFSWHPGRPVETKQTVEVHFSSDGHLTHVELIHRDWEVFAEKADEMHEGYTKGWAKVLGECYLQGVEARGAGA